MKLIMENFRSFIKEETNDSPFPTSLGNIDIGAQKDPIDIHFPIINYFKSDEDNLMKRMRHMRTAMKMAIDAGELEYLGRGSFRTTYSIKSDPDKVLKIINISLVPRYVKKSIQMNQEDISFSKEFPLLFPKTYISDEKGIWFIMDKVKPIKSSNYEDLEGIVRKTFSKEIKLLQKARDGHKTPNDYWMYDYNFWTPSDLLYLIALGALATAQKSEESKQKSIHNWLGKSSPLQAKKDLRAGRAVSEIVSKEAGQHFHELGRAMAKYNIDPSEIRGGNIGMDTEGKFKILDSSIF